MRLPIALLLLTIPASAVTLYDEASQGDLPQNATAPVFNPTIGNNVVYGTATLTTVVFDIDKFSFIVQPGQTASNLTYSFSNSLLVGSEQVSGNVWVYTGTIPTGLAYLTNAHWIARGAGSSLSSTASPVVINTGTLGPGSYTVSFEPNGRSINGGSVPYSVSFDLTAVPEPSSALLLLLFSGTALAIQRRRA